MMRMQRDDVAEMEHNMGRETHTRAHKETHCYGNLRSFNVVSATFLCDIVVHVRVPVRRRGIVF